MICATCGHVREAHANAYGPHPMSPRYVDPGSGCNATVTTTYSPNGYSYPCTCYQFALPESRKEGDVPDPGSLH